MRKIIYFILLLFISAFIFYQFKNNIIPIFSFSSPYLVINNKIIKVEIADDFDEYSQGLSFRKKLNQDEGMLFIFPDKQVKKFWMKNMNFPLDIIWLDCNQRTQTGKIVNISYNLLPEGEQPEKSYSSTVPVNYVLEVNARLANKYSIKIGDKVKLNL
jgi:uncharacterized membrane protein (UPF0127 family)